MTTTGISDRHDDDPHADSAVGYIRVSTLEQSDQGVSLSLQESRLRAYCDLKGLQLVSVIRDECVSGSKPLSDRPGGHRLLDLISIGSVGNVVALKLDRLFRNASDALNETTLWDRGGVGLHLVDQGGATIDTKNSVGKLFFTLLAAMAEFERNLIAERTTAAMRYKKEKREAYSPTPFGFDRVGDDLVENPRELAIVRQIQKWRDKGLSLGAIAAKLNQESVSTKNGRTWHGSTVNYILKNSIYRRSA